MSNDVYIVLYLSISAVGCDFTVRELYLEVTDVLRTTYLVTMDTDTIVYTADLAKTGLTSLPTNLCEFQETLNTVDLSDNYLTNVSTVRCLYNLHVLHLDNNRLQVVSNSTFYNMTYLR